MKINNSFINLVKLLQTLSRTLFLRAARLFKILELCDAYLRKNQICVYILYSYTIYTKDSFIIGYNYFPCISSINSCFSRFIEPVFYIKSNCIFDTLANTDDIRSSQNTDDIKY